MTAKTLIVDDSLTVRMDLDEAFAAAGLPTVLAASAAEMRRALEREPNVALVILDVVLPDADGIDLLRELRQRTSPLHILLLSTEAEVADRIRGLETGADDYVGKPYDAGYVIARARHLLGSRSVPARSTILVVDDSVTFREELKRSLEEAHYVVATASSGEEGLKLAAGLRPAAILVDSVMPGIDGGTLIRRVRLDAALRGTPCVLLTASEGHGAELRALDAGADAFVRKEDAELILARLQAVLRSATPERPARAASLLDPKRILAVDDSSTYLSELSDVLRSEGYEVVGARSGEDALEMLAAQPVDCVLLDLVMPGMDGIETCRLIKASPHFRDIPLVMLTAREDRAAMIEGLSTGADDFIAKSSEFEVLKARVRAQLRRKQFEDEHRHIREQLLRSELEATEARAAREVAEARARMVEALEAKNLELSSAYHELKQTQSHLVQSAKLASLGELVAGVAHEINNPLAFAMSHLRTAQSCLRALPAEPPPLEGSMHFLKARARLDEMAGGLARISELVLKLRTFSRLDEGERKVVNLQECLDSVLTILAHRLRHRIEVTVSLAEPITLDCYPSLLNQALMNVISNAADAIGDGETTGQITILGRAEGASYVLSITDTGCGIPESVRERVFDPFFTTKEVGKGTGLGLSITYSIIKKHGGTLALLPAPGRGTVAEIHLPLAGPPEEVSAAAAAR